MLLVFKICAFVMSSCLLVHKLDIDLIHFKNIDTDMPKTSDKQ